MLFPIDVIVAVIYRTLISTTTSGADVAIPAMIFWTGVLCVFTLVAVDIASRLMLKHIRRTIFPPELVRTYVNYLDTFSRAVIVVVYIIMIESAGWPGELSDKLGIGGSEFLDSLLGLMPYILLFSFSRMSFRRLDSEISKNRSTVLSYMFFKMRTTLFIMVPWLCMWLLYDCISLVMFISEKLGWADEASIVAFLSSAPLIEFLFSLLMLLPVVIFFPIILVKIWQCKILPDGELKSKLEDLQEKAGVGFDKIYIWQLGGSAFLNGAVVGFIRPFRFLLLSKGLLENLTEEEVCGVVGHELGHVKYRHLLWYLFFTSAFISTAAALLQNNIFDPHLLAIFLCLLIAGYLRIIFGFVSRRFERQADLFGLEIMGRAEPLASSLEKIGFLSGGIRRVKSWHHRSIAERVDFLHRAENNPAVRMAHHSHCGKVKLIGASLAMISIIFFVQASSARQPEYNTGFSQANIQDYFKHWRFISEYFPDDAESKIMQVEIALMEGFDHRQITSGELLNLLREAEKQAEKAEEYQKIDELKSRIATEYEEKS